MIALSSGAFASINMKNTLLSGRFRAGLLLLLLLATTLFSGKIFAAGGDLTLFSSNTTANGQEYSVKIQVLILMTLLGLLPIMLLMMTCFTRFIIVLAILRQALGLQQSPPNKILTGIALALTLLIMRPVWDQVYTTAVEPFQNDQITLNQALSNAESPLKTFMLAQTSKKALSQIMDIAKVTGEPKDQSLSVIIPAFVLSELKTAFQIGFMIYIPFLVIDMIVASVLMAMGMMMLSPLIVSLPFKLMLFVLCDGWALTVGTLTASIQAT
ncbi:Flagellar biosynthetic protein fliP precursor [Pragia fontium]|nr:Flagellar biosynthetic protein fliP precursor [Pragia fontium]